MNEINDIKIFIRALCQREVVSRLEKTVEEQAGGKFFLVFPTLPSRQKNLHLFVEDKNELNLVKGAELTGIIKETLGYDYTSDDIGAQIEVTYSSRIKNGREREAFEDRLPLTAQTVENGSVEQFLARHYPLAVPSLRAKTTERKNSDEENAPNAHSPEETVRYLSQLPESEFESILQKAREQRIINSQQKMISSK